MAWVKVPPEHHPLFLAALAALPKDPRVETLRMFGGIAAKVNGHFFAGLFGRSTMVLLSEADRVKALALEGAAPFDPMGNGRMSSDKIMLPAGIMREPAALRRWLSRAFESAAALPEKQAKRAPPKRPKARSDEAPPGAPRRGTPSGRAPRRG